MILDRKEPWQAELLKIAANDLELSGFLRGMAAVADERPEVRASVVELQYFAWLLARGGASGVDPFGSTAF